LTGATMLWSTANIDLRVSITLQDYDVERGLCCSKCSWIGESLSVNVSVQ